MKVTFTQKEINEFVAKHLGFSIEIDVEISKDSAEMPINRRWIKNTQTIPHHPQSLDASAQIMPLWTDDDVLQGSASTWENGWDINSAWCHITHYKVIGANDASEEAN